MDDILALVGGLLLAVQVWKWFSALALLVFGPFAALARHIIGSKNRATRRGGLLRWPHWPRTAIAVIVMIIPLPIIAPLLLVSLIAFWVTLLDRMLNQRIKKNVTANKDWVVKGLNLGLTIYEKSGIRMTRQIRRERRRNWAGNLLDNVIAAQEVPYSGTLGVICVIAAFVLKLL